MTRILDGVASTLQSNTAEHLAVGPLAPALPTSGLQCPVCGEELCQTHDLCFFQRRNAQGGTEVHLILRPEIQVPQTLVQTLKCSTKKGATQSWQCVCGTKIADTRPVGPNKARMTAFKSSKVTLCGQHHPGKKSTTTYK